MKYENLFTPVQIGNIRLKNRFATMALGAANGAMCRWRAVMRGGTGPR